VNGVASTPGRRRRDGALPRADIAVANISLELVQAAGPRPSRPGDHRRLPARDRPELPGFRHLERRELDGWARTSSARS
jgi:hypothetical protein